MTFHGSDLLFVYGSLRRGNSHPMARTLEAQAVWMGVSRVEGLLYRIDWYPGLVPPNAAGQWVEGDLYRMTAPDHLLPLLDEYEECSPGFALPQEYRRETAMVAFAGAFHCAWTYYYNHPLTGRRRIEAGNGDGISRFSAQRLHRTRSI